MRRLARSPRFARKVFVNKNPSSARPSPSPFSNALSTPPILQISSQNIIYFENKILERLYSTERTKIGAKNTQIAEKEKDGAYFGAQPSAFWDDEANVREFALFLQKALRFERPADVFRVKMGDVAALGGEKLLEKNPTVMCKIGRILFPYAAEEWLPWRFPSVPRNFWTDISNQRDYINWLSRKLRFNHPEDWYRVESADFSKHYGQTIFRLYNGSPWLLLKTLYPEFDFKPWLFTRLAHNYFDERLHREKYVLWLMERVGVNDGNELISSHFTENSGQSLLRKYGMSVTNVLESLDEEDSNSTIVIPTEKKRTRVPKNFWASMENQKKLIEDISVKLGHKRGDLEQWYSVTSRKFHSLGGGGMITHHYDNSMWKMLSSIYPNFDWKPWKFVQASKTVVRDPEMVKKAVKEAEEILGISSPLEWKRVTHEKLKELETLKVFLNNGGVFRTLKVVYPDADFSEKKGKENPGLKRSGEALLGKSLRKIWPNFEIIEEYSDLELVFDSTKEIMKFDYYVPAVKIAFEFQGQQHYDQLSAYGDVSQRIEKDRHKETKCNSLGITLIHVPYWWNGTLGSLLLAIFDKRPDLKNELFLPFLKHLDKAKVISPTEPN